MAFLDFLKRLFGAAGQTDRPGGTDASGSGGPPGETGTSTIPCEEASARLFEFLDGELEGVSEEEVRHHLEVCEACYPRVQFEKHFLEALRGSRNGGRASESLKERVLQALEEDQGLD